MSIRGPYFTIGLWFDQPIFPSALLAVGDVLMAGGGRYDGDVTVGPSDVPFTYLSDIDDRRSLDRRVVEGTRAGTVEGTVYELGLRLPLLGEAHVHFGRVPTPVPASGHPVEIDMPAELVSFTQVGPKEGKQVKAQHRGFLRRLKALCVALDPAYALMGEDIDTPTPAELVSGYDRLGWSPFISHRLAARAELVEPLTRLAARCKVQDWGTGCHYEWVTARRDRDREALWAADQAVSVALGRALASSSRVR